MKLPRGSILIVASHNPGKVREIKALLGPHGIEPIGAADLHLPEPVAMSVGLGTFTADMTEAQMQWWVDACKELGLYKGAIPIRDMVAD